MNGPRRGFVRVATRALRASAAFRRRLESEHTAWRATPTEARATLPGDDVVHEPAARTTRAITIGAAPDAVWPWLLQIGADRGGFYSYDRLENLFGLGVHSADAVVQEWQGLHAGDVVYATRRRSGGWYVDEVDPGRALVLRLADLHRGRPLRRTDPHGWEFAWAFVLNDRGDGTTRLLVRESVAYGSRTTRWLMVPAGPVSLLMTRRMLRGIKERAEQGRPTVSHEELRSTS